uniref:Midline fasciclinlike [Tribolium castaneum] n=1 Tax=Lepeophtheirus salmonis TaxID=72036 RepID=A0A0K2U317_LEPSM
MRLFWIITFIIGVSHGAHEFTNEATHLWDQIYDGFETIHDSAYKEINPWATSLEAKVGEALDDIFEPQRRRNDNVDSDKDSQEPSTNTPQLHQQSFPLNQLFQNVFKMPQSLFPTKRNWWNGENVCVERKVIDESKNATSANEEEENRTQKGIRLFMDFSMTSCRDEINLHECTTTVNKNGEKKTIVVTHSCCYGHVRRDEDDSGCEKVDMTTLEETIEKLGSDEFLKLLQSTKFNIESGNYTIFVPNNDAVEDYKRDIEGINALDIDGSDVKYKISRNKRYAVESSSFSNLVKGHIVDGFVDSSDVHDENVFPSVEDASKIRMTVYNTYPKKTWMANCAKVISQNNYAKNGIVHVVDKVIRPVKSTILELLGSDPQFEEFKKLIESVANKDDTIKKLSEMEGQFTVFAPTNAAFEKLSKRIQDKLRSGSGCAIDILKNHILPNVICSGVIEGKARTVNTLGKYLMLNKEDDMELTVQDIPVFVNDIIGTNGVLHAIEEFLIPESSKLVEDVLEDASLDTFKKYLKEVDMLEALDARDNITIFAPTNRALEILSRDFVSDKKKLKDFLLYHIANTKVCQCEFKNDQELSTARKDQKLKINTYNGSGAFLLGVPAPDVATVQCARISKRDVEMCGGMIHKVDKVLFPPFGSIQEILKSEDKYSKFSELAEESGLDMSNEQYTLLLPTNSAFESLSEEVMAKINSNRTYWVPKIVEKHILSDSYCCASIAPRNIFIDTSGKRTMSNEIVSLRKSVGGRYFANDAEISTCDVVATNGVIHTIDRVLLPREMESRNKGGDPILPFRSIIYSGLFK